MRSCIRNLFLVLATSSILVACTGKKLSDRDQKLQQQRSQADSKRQELSVVSGKYLGHLKSDAGLDQEVLLNMEVKDIPEQQEGTVDPVLVPKLVGYLRFLYGGPNSDEYVDCVVKQAEYRDQAKDLYLVITHQQFGDLVMELKSSENTISGNWKAAQVGASGSTTLSK